MEVKRQRIDPNDLRVRRHIAPDLLRGDMDDEELERYGRSV